MPWVLRNVSHVYHQFVLRVKRRDELFEFLKTQGIGVGLHYPAPVHLQPAYRSRIPIAPGTLKITEQLQPKILSLPMHPFLTEQEVQTVIAGIVRWCDRPHAAIAVPPPTLTQV